MKRAMKNTLPVLLWLSAGMPLVSCGSLTPTTDPSIAGGSGAGNPAGTVVLAMYAKTGRIAGQEKLAQSSTVIDSAGSIAVTDKGGARLTLTNVIISNAAVRFSLDSSERPDSLLFAMHETHPELSPDTNCIVYTGGHDFDAVHGMVDSAVTALRLPIGRYSGVTLGFKNFQAGNPQWGQGDTDCSTITMNGVMLYGGVMHALTIDITCASMPPCRYFPFGGGIFTLSASDTTHLDLKFDADKWFSSIDLAASLGNGSLSFDSTGALNISNAMANPYVGELQSVIASAFFASGTLVVY
jgi:hypothetical protein